ncbi:ACT domain-containing protein [Streptomyces sp. NBC_01142]|uniref:ACT domain-containing protein n=1 Tax=Streptomyces sp. NBC_01142 TaxID=2975865 RepID=UPI002253F9CF|nr:ACT domain-containing protein [Streptomyces sp. NBC_01142]MCX4820792.1 ACT domain-containing protein [Streptomyces sp. NBC_01142]
MITPPVQRLRILSVDFTIEHLADGQLPTDDSWYALLRAPEGLTVVREARGPGEPSTATASPQDRWAGFYGDVAHGLDLPGMLAAVIGPLAAAAVPVFVSSTFHSDLVLVPRVRMADACVALRAAGHEVVESG